MHDLVLRRLLALVDADVAAEPKHGDAVRGLEDVVEVVRDEDDREPLLGEALDERSTCSVCETPSAAVGSSRITSLEFHITARATATDCRCPPESVATGWRIERIVVTASVFSVSLVFASIGGSFRRWNQLCTSRPRYMFWTTSRLSQSARSW